VVILFSELSVFNDVFLIQFSVFVAFEILMFSFLIFVILLVACQFYEVIAFCCEVSQ